MRVVVPGGSEGHMPQVMLNDGPATLTRTALICDDRVVARSALTRRLSHFTIVAAVPDGRSALDVLLTGMPHVVLIGVHRDSYSGQHAMRMVLDTYPSAVVVVFGAAGDAQVLAAAVADGASGVMQWDTHQPRHPSVHPPLPQRADPQAVRRRSPLTERELGVLREISRGRSNLEIGHDLELSQDSVKNAARRVFLKLGARDRAHAVALAMRHGLAI